MSKLLWAGAGAVGGIYLYRKGQSAWDEAKERGVVGGASTLVSTTSALLGQSRARLSGGRVNQGAPVQISEHVIQLPLANHEPGMLYQVRAIPASEAVSAQTAQKRGPSTVAKLASWKAARSKAGRAQRQLDANQTPANDGADVRPTSITGDVAQERSIA